MGGPASPNRGDFAKFSMTGGFSADPPLHTSGLDIERQSDKILNSMQSGYLAEVAKGYSQNIHYMDPIRRAQRKFQSFPWKFQKFSEFSASFMINSWI